MPTLMLALEKLREEEKSRSLFAEIEHIYAALFYVDIWKRLPDKPLRLLGLFTALVDDLCEVFFEVRV